jgi:hypothetical protein
VQTKFQRVQAAFLSLLLISVQVILPLSQSNSAVMAQSAKSDAGKLWSLDEAMAQLSSYPNDAFLQYVALQLAMRESKLEQTIQQLETLRRDAGLEMSAAQGRRASVDLFSLFTGALAVQESLQLDTMRGDGANVGFTPMDDTQSAEPARAAVAAAVAASQAVPAPVPNAQKSARRKRTSQRRTAQRTKRNVRQSVVEADAVSAIPPQPEMSAEEKAAQAEWEKQQREMEEQERKRRENEQRAREYLKQKSVAVASLSGPTIQGHPWEKMLAEKTRNGRAPEISSLAKLVPEDFYFVEFRSLTKLLDFADNSDVWSAHFFNQAFQQSHSQNLSERLKKQFALETSALLRPFYDLAVENVAVTGSDLFIREGSDVTLIFKLRQSQLARMRLDSMLESAAKANADAKRINGNYQGVDYAHVTNADRSLSVISAYPSADICIRSNSLAAFKAVVDAINGRNEKSATVRRLGEATEFAYIRTLMPRGAAEEDGFVYLSDPFIRRLVGPQLKLAERRRMLVYNHLRMIGHAALMFRTEHGRPPQSLKELAEKKCAPGTFGAGNLTAADGGTYSLSADGLHGVHSRYGQMGFLTPNIELPVSEVTGREAYEYTQFLNEYNQYWRQYFDPIALRLRSNAQQYRVETIILPLIDNSIYTSMASVFGGKPEPLDVLPLPAGNIFSLSVRFNKEKVLEQIGLDQKTLARELSDATPSQMLSQQTAEKSLQVLEEGFGSQIGIHVYDAKPVIDLNLSELMGWSLRETAGRRSDFMSSIGLAVAGGVLALTSPFYISLTVKDAQMVDDYLREVESVLSRPLTGIREINLENYRFSLTPEPLTPGERAKAGQLAYSSSIKFGPVKLRFFYARIGNALYITNRPEILSDLKGASVNVATNNDSDASGHAMVRLRPQNWNLVRKDYQLGWAENQRLACHQNLGPLSSVARISHSTLQRADDPPREIAPEILTEAESIYGVQFSCPDQGRYLLRGGSSVYCSVHGQSWEAIQPMIPTPESSAENMMKSFQGGLATLEFTEDGLRAVVRIDRKP